MSILGDLPRSIHNFHHDNRIQYNASYLPVNRVDFSCSHRQALAVLGKSDIDIIKALGVIWSCKVNEYTLPYLRHGGFLSVTICLNIIPFALT